MKPKKKSKFDIKAFFTMHGEKVAFILIIPLAIYVAYQGTLYEPLKWQPNELVQASDAADTFIKTNERRAVDEGVTIFSYDSYAQWIKKDIVPDLYRTETPWLPSLFPEKVKRGSVPVFTVNDLRARSGLGALVLSQGATALSEIGIVDVPTATPGAGGAASASATANRIGERWAIVTGLIPIKQQLDVYINKFASSVHPDPVRDMPIYVLYDVERAVIEPGKVDPEWEPLPFVAEAKKKQALWGSGTIGSTFDPVDPTFLAPPAPVSSFPMAYPLPPIDKKFGEEAAHPPVIPMLAESQTELMKEVEELQKKQLKEMFEVDKNTILRGEDPFGTSNTGADSGSGMSSGGRRRPGGAEPRRGARTRRAQEEEEDIKPVMVENYLYRFFDFTVEPGKTYRYRVRLYLLNPNYNLGPTVLEDETLSKERTLVTEFSTPSNAITIPLETRVLVSSVNPGNPKMPWLDPNANILAVYFNKDDGSEWLADKDRLTRGTTVNFKDTVLVNPMLAEDSSSSTGMESGMPKPRTPPRTPPRGRNQPAAPKEKDNEKKIDVVSDVCLLDMIGGNPLPKTNSPAARDVPEMKSPGKIIVLEPSGNLVVRHVNTDLVEVDSLKNPVTTSIGRGSEGMSGMDGMGGGMGGRGMP